MSLRAKVLAGGVLLGALILGVFITAHYQAKEKVLEYKRTLQATGEKMTFAELRPAATVEAASRAQALVTAVDQLGDVESNLTNFPPVMRSLGPGLAQVAWKQDPLPTHYSSNIWPDLSRTLDEKQEPLADVRGLLASPGLAFNLDYSQGFKLTMPHLSRLKRAALWLSAATIRELHAGQLDRAEQNLEAVCALRSQQGEPVMWSEQVRLDIDQIALGTTWEALQCPDWSEEQLRRLQVAWSLADWLNQAEAALAMQRLCNEQVIAMVRADHSVLMCGCGRKTGTTEIAELGRQLFKDPVDGLKEIAGRYPLYWWWMWWQSYDDELMSLQYLQAGIESVRAMRQHELFGTSLQQFDKEVVRIRQAHPQAGRWFQDCLQTEYPARRLLERILAAEIRRSLCVTAIAIHRYRLRQGAYPAALTALVPEFLPEVPRDVIDGQPLHYSLQPDGSFRLYSIGEDAQDNGGNPGPRPGYLFEEYWWCSRDAVWPSPATIQKAQLEKERLEREARLAQQRAIENNPALADARRAFLLRYGLLRTNAQEGK